MNTSIRKLALSMAGFSAGVAAGILLAPRAGKESRRWIHDQTQEAREWMEYAGNRFLKDSEAKLRNISSGMKEVLPDLYEATEELQLNEDELEDTM